MSQFCTNVEADVSRETSSSPSANDNNTDNNPINLSDTRRGRYSSEGMAMVVLGKNNLSKVDSKAMEEGLSRSAMLRKIIEEHFDEKS